GDDRARDRPAVLHQHLRGEAREHGDRRRPDHEPGTEPAGAFRLPPEQHDGRLRRRILRRLTPGGPSVMRGPLPARVAELADAQEEHKRQPAAPPRIETNAVSPGQPFKYVATVEVRPHFEPKDYLGLPLTKVDESIDERMVDSEIEELRQSQSMFVPVEGRDS